MDNKYWPKFNQKSSGIETVPFMGHEVHVIDTASSQSLALLEQAYNGIYLDAFPMEEERDSLDLMHEGLKGNMPHKDVIGVIIGENLSGKNPVIKTLGTADYYPKGDVSLMRYLAVDESIRGQKLGLVTLNARKNVVLQKAHEYGHELSGVFIFCNDPAKVSLEKDSMDPATRIKIFEGYGARRVPIDCLLPPLLPGYPACDYMTMLSHTHPVTGMNADVSAIKKMMHSIYIDLDPDTKPEDSPYFQQVLRNIDAMAPAYSPVPAVKTLTLDI